MPRTPLSLNRRALATGGFAATLVALAGCDAVDGILGGDQDPGGSGPVTPTAPAVDADSALVTEVAGAIAAVGALATATGAAVPALARIGTHLARIHEAHVDRLGGAEPVEPPAVPAARATALQRLMLAEARLQDRLVEAAGQAGSGGLAQVLASMAAALAQQRAALG